MFVGFYDGLQMERNDEIHECEFLLTDKVEDNLYDLYNKTMEFKLFDMLNIAADMSYNAYPIYE